MTTPLDAVANAGLAPQLKAEQFRKVGRTWRRRVEPDEAIQIVNLQGSMFATAGHGRAALNVAVYFPVLAASLGLGALTDTPSEADAHLRRRAAMLKPDGRDAWIEFTSDDLTSITSAGADCLALYRDFGAPWLSRVSTLRGARNEFVRTNSMWLAAAASIAMQDLAAAQSFIAEALNHASATMLPHLTQWANRHALV
jgi:hypothetical protein